MPSTMLGCMTLAMMSGTAVPRDRSGSRSTRPSRWRSSTTTILLAARTTIQQSQAQEITANLRPNPVLFSDWEYLPLFAPEQLDLHLPRTTQPKSTSA